MGRRKKVRRTEVTYIIYEQAMWNRRQAYDTNGVPGFAKVGGKVYVIAVPKEEVENWGFEQLELEDWAKAMEVRGTTKALTGKKTVKTRIDSRKIVRRHYVGRWSAIRDRALLRGNVLKSADSLRDWLTRCGGVVYS